MTEDEYTVLCAQLDRAHHELDSSSLESSIHKILRLQRILLGALWEIQKQVEEVAKLLNGTQASLLDVIKTMQRRIESRQAEERHD
jgi:hypothetical protein